MHLEISFARTHSAHSDHEATRDEGRAGRGTSQGQGIICAMSPPPAWCPPRPRRRHKTHARDKTPLTCAGATPYGCTCIDTGSYTTYPLPSYPLMDGSVASDRKPCVDGRRRAVPCRRRRAGSAHGVGSYDKRGNSSSVVAISVLWWWRANALALERRCPLYRREASLGARHGHAQLCTRNHPTHSMCTRNHPTHKHPMHSVCMCMCHRTACTVHTPAG